MRAVRVQSAPRYLDVLAVSLVVLYAPAGLAVFLFRFLFYQRRAPINVRPWFLLLAILFCLSVISWIKGYGATAPAIQAAVILIGGFVLRVPKSSIWLGYVIGLGLAVALLAVGHLSARHTWYLAGDSQLSMDRYIAFLTGRQRILSHGIDRTNFYRHWDKPDSGNEVQLAFSARAQSGDVGHHWFAYNFSTPIALHSADGRKYTRVQPDSAGHSFITRRANTDSALSNRSFTLTIELRMALSSSNVASSNVDCAGIVIRELGGSNYSECLPVEATEEWSEYQVKWVFPEHATSTAFRVELHFQSPWYEVGGARVTETTDDLLRHIALEPTGMHVRISIPGEPQYLWPTYAVQLSTDWQDFKIDFRDDRLERLERIRTGLLIESGYQVEVRNSRLTFAPGTRATPIAYPNRQSGTHGDPNLAGHSVTATGLAAAALASSMRRLLPPLALLAASIFMTESRAAWLSFIFGSLGLLALALFRTKKRWFSTMLLVSVALGILGYLQVGGHLGRLQNLSLNDGNSVSRVEIWRFSISELREQPLLGSKVAFGDAWRTAHPNDDRNPPVHAHNFWLQLAYEYGILGFALAVLFSINMVYIARTTSGAEGTIMVLSILVMNLFDFTLFYMGVWVPVMLFLQSSTRLDP